MEFSGQKGHFFYYLKLSRLDLTLQRSHQDAQTVLPGCDLTSTLICTIPLPCTHWLTRFLCNSSCQEVEKKVLIINSFTMNNSLKPSAET